MPPISPLSFLLAADKSVFFFAAVFAAAFLGLGPGFAVPNLSSFCLSTLTSGLALASTFFFEAGAESGDYNGDGIMNVIDIVAMVEAILNGI